LLANVGAMLLELKAVTPHGEFQQRAAEIGVTQRTSSNLMTLARHLPLLEGKRPASGRVDRTGPGLSRR
jgi:hypothetical protein